MSDPKSDPLTAKPDVLAFLNTRRSHSYKTLTSPVPEKAELSNILAAAARAPDHGAAVPFRFVVLERAALARIGDMIPACGARLGKKDVDIAKQRLAYDTGNLAVAVVEVRKPSKHPELEQTYTVGAVCLALVNAALASGWGANWLSGWASHDPEFCHDAFGLRDGERLAGLIHIGTATVTPSERSRPDIDAITSWVSA
ncbi:MAG: nitroreductase family protein [Pseudomonadota bacterium]